MPPSAPMASASSPLTTTPPKSGMPTREPNSSPSPATPGESGPPPSAPMASASSPPVSTARQSLECRHAKRSPSRDRRFSPMRRHRRAATLTARSSSLATRIASTPPLQSRWPAHRHPGIDGTATLTLELLPRHAGSHSCRPAPMANALSCQDARGHHRRRITGHSGTSGPPPACRRHRQSRETPHPRRPLRRSPSPGRSLMQGRLLIRCSCRLQPRGSSRDARPTAKSGCRHRRRTLHSHRLGVIRRLQPRRSAHPHRQFDQTASGWRCGGASVFRRRRGPI